MKNESDSSPDPFNRALVIDEICDRFEEAWQRGETPSIDSSLQCDSSIRDEVFVHILAIDRDYRSKSGRSLSQSEYLSKFPDFQDAISKSFDSDSNEKLDGFSQFATIDLGTRSGNSVGSQPASSPIIGQNIQYFGDYEILGEIARGGMGVVYRARQISLNRIIALKMILSGQIASEDQIRRFQLEAEAAANLDHPGIVPIYDIGNHQGQHYFSMKLIHGKTVTEAKDSLLKDPAKAVGLVAKIADAVHHAHQRGILHRDLKPANIILDEEGNPVVTDFGLARNIDSEQQLTQSGAVLGTPGFMSPEQASGSITTTATDIYSLGAILYSLLSGRPPHSKTSMLETLLAVKNEVPLKLSAINPKLDSDLDLIVQKCLSKQPSDRYASTAELAADLRAYLAGQPLRVRSPSITELARLWLSNNFGNALWVPIIAIVVGCASGFSMLISTLGADFSQNYKIYEFFGHEHRSWMVQSWLWNPFIGPIVTLGLALLIGWATAKLSKTKNPTADLGAGLSVGLLAGLLAFATGFGPMLSTHMGIENNEDLKTLAQIASGGWPAAQVALEETYPLMETVSVYNRAFLISEKVILDTETHAVRNIWFSAVFCLTVYGLIGTSQTWVAGKLLRSKSKLDCLIGYSCFSLAIVTTCFVVWADLGNWAMVGATYHLNWWLPIGCIAFFGWSMYSVVRDWSRLAQVALTSLAMVLFSLFFVTDWTSNWPRFCKCVADIKFAEKSLAINKRITDRVRVSKAHGEFARLLQECGRTAQANEEYRRAMAAIEDGLTSSNLSHPAKNYHATLLYWAANFAVEQHRDNDAKTIFAKLFELYVPNEYAYITYAKLLTRLGETDELASFISRVGSETPESWWQVGHIMRTIADSPSKVGLSLPQSHEMLVDSVLKKCEKLPAARRESLRAWLLSRQVWKLWGPVSSSTATTHIELLRETPSLENRLLKPNQDDLVADKDCDQWTGSLIDLVRFFGVKQNNAIYAATSFHLPTAQSITIRIGSDDAHKSWVDDQFLGTAELTRSAYEGNDRFSIDLPAGKHSLLLKIAQRSGDWACVVDAADSEGWPIAIFGTPPERDEK